MKNIHILPTDKPSRIYLIKSNNKLGITSNNPEFTENFGSGTQNQHIYITSDEEIKDVRPYKGKWQLESGLILNKFPNYLTDLSECKLVIMTTDQDLIKDGVQSIDDEFLEFIVKNPSCERVEVMFACRGIDVLIGKIIGQYKIIIPKEEPKQRLEKYSERFDNKDNELVQGVFNPDTWGKRIVEQKILEEAKDLAYWRANAEEDYLQVPISVLRYISQLEQQKRSYSEEDMIKFMQFIVSEEELENTSGVSIDTAKYFLNKFKNKFKNK